MLVLFVFIDT